MPKQCPLSKPSSHRQEKRGHRVSVENKYTHTLFSRLSLRNQPVLVRHIELRQIFHFFIMKRVENLVTLSFHSKERALYIARSYFVEQIKLQPHACSPPGGPIQPLTDFILICIHIVVKIKHATTCYLHQLHMTSRSGEM